MLLLDNILVSHCCNWAIYFDDVIFFIATDIIVNGGDGVAAAALRDIEEKRVVVANNASKSTMIIHASRKVSTVPTIFTCLDYHSGKYSKEYRTTFLKLQYS